MTCRSRVPALEVDGGLVAGSSGRLDFRDGKQVGGCRARRVPIPASARTTEFVRLRLQGHDVGVVAGESLTAATPRPYWTLAVDAPPGRGCRRKLCGVLAWRSLQAPLAAPVRLPETRPALESSDSNEPSATLRRRRPPRSGAKRAVAGVELGTARHEKGGEGMRGRRPGRAGAAGALRGRRATISGA
jgi:hypothetical protein